MVVVEVDVELVVVDEVDADFFSVATALSRREKPAKTIRERTIALEEHAKKIRDLIIFFKSILRLALASDHKSF